MTTFRLNKDLVEMYYKNDNPIILFLFEHCGDSEFGKNWLFTRIPTAARNLDTLRFDPIIELYIKDPEAALMFKLKFGV